MAPAEPYEIVVETPEIPAREADTLGPAELVPELTVLVAPLGVPLMLPIIALITAPGCTSTSMFNDDKPLKA